MHALDSDPKSKSNAELVIRYNDRCVVVPYLRVVSGETRAEQSAVS